MLTVRGCVSYLLILAMVLSIPADTYARDKLYRAQNDVLYFDDECIEGPTAKSMNTTTSPTGAGCGEQGYANGTRNSQKNKEQIWSFLKSKGLSDEAAAGIMGNMDKESAFMPDAVNSIGCSGLVQWCYDRNDAMRAKAEAEGKDWRCLDYQLEYMWYEMTETSESQVMEPLKGATSPGEAANIFHDIYERSNTATGEHLGRDTRAENIYKEFTGKDPVPLPDSKSGKGSDNCPQGRSGASSAVSEMDGFNYAFPVQLAKNEVSNGYSWPCPGSCHHDGTDAFDLSRHAQDDSSEHVPVVAITDGQIARFNTSYSGVDGCQSFQLVGKDGYMYWYGHIQASSVTEMAEVSAGQVISEIGRRACTGNGSYPHLHIDRGNKGTMGGSVGNRDPGFTPVMNKLWEQLDGGEPSSDINL